MRTILGAAVVLIGVMLCYPASPLALSQAQTVVLAGRVFAGPDSLAYAQVTATLTSSNCWTSTDVVGPCSKTVTADANGAWTMTLIGTDSLTCKGGFSPTYTLTMKSAPFDKVGVTIQYDGLSIPATNGSTTQLQAILAAQ